MRPPHRAPSTTALPTAPRDESAGRARRYIITMGIRIACFILMVAITPYGWYTWVFAAGAIFLPYVAVVIANVGSDSRREPERPERALPPAQAHEPPVAPSESGVIRIHETPTDDRRPGAA